MIPCELSYYGGFRTRTFADIFPDLATFEDNLSVIADAITIKDKELIWYLLYARYGNSHIAMSDENQFRAAINSTIFMYGPSWEKRLEIQANLRNLTEADMLTGGKAIYNHSYNPSTAPTTSSLEELNTINEQNTTNYKKSKLEGYSMLLSLLETDVTEEFIGKFKKLFLTVVAPDYPLLYKTEMENEND